VAVIKGLVVQGGGHARPAEFAVFPHPLLDGESAQFPARPSRPHNAFMRPPNGRPASPPASNKSVLFECVSNLMNFPRTWLPSSRTDPWINF